MTQMTLQTARFRIENSPPSSTSAFINCPTSGACSQSVLETGISGTLEPVNWICVDIIPREYGTNSRRQRGLIFTNFLTTFFFFTYYYFLFSQLSGSLYTILGVYEVLYLFKLGEFNKHHFICTVTV